MSWSSSRAPSEVWDPETHVPSKKDIQYLDKTEPTRLKPREKRPPKEKTKRPPEG